MAVDRLTAEDRLMLWSDESWPQDIGALAVLDGHALLDSDGRFRLGAAREAIERRLHRLPRFRQVLYQPRRGGGWPLWADASAFDIRDHVRATTVPVPGEEPQLLLAVEQLRSHPLHRSRPLWEIWFLPGLLDARIGMFIRLHHVIADGIAGVSSLVTLLDAVPDARTPPAPAWTPAPRPADSHLFVDNLRRRAGQFRRAANVVAHPSRTVRRARTGWWPAMRELMAQQPGPRTSLNRLIGPHRSLALFRSDLDEVRQIAHIHDATVNDVLLTMVAGGLRKLLSSRGELVQDLTMPIYVPVSLRRDRTSPGTGNLISQMVVPLPLGTADPRQKLRQIAAQTTNRKAIDRPSLGAVFRTRLLARIMLPVIANKRVNIESADLVGPAAPLYFGGAELLEVFPLLNLIGNVSLGVGALSYAGQFNALAVGDAATYPDIDLFTAGARTELDILRSGTGGAQHPAESA